MCLRHPPSLRTEHRITHEAHQGIPGWVPLVTIDDPLCMLGTQLDESARHGTRVESGQ
ncbi:Uncharacterised protein [Mycobacteroides abscessus subsp. abscessus]|nr:Uncharacterised protein [Mycobacteroides abscessus subsp. abscessus]